MVCDKLGLLDGALVADLCVRGVWIPHTTCKDIIVASYLPVYF